MSRGREPIGVVGSGRAAEALAFALTSSGWRVSLWARDARRRRRAATRARAASANSIGELLDASDALLICVNDHAVQSVARQIADADQPDRPSRVALHTAGALSRSALAPLDEVGWSTGVFHPAVSLAGKASVEHLDGAYATVSGDTRSLRLGRELCRRLGLKAVRVDDAQRPLVHAAAVMASGDAVTLLAEAEDLLREAGMRPADARGLLSQLAVGSIERYAERGAVRAMTGPVPRDDLATVDAQLQSLGAHRRHRIPAGIHRRLLAAAVRRLQRAGRLSDGRARRWRKALDAEH